MAFKLASEVSNSALKNADPKTHYRENTTSVTHSVHYVLQVLLIFYFFYMWGIITPFVFCISSNTKHVCTFFPKLCSIAAQVVKCCLRLQAHQSLSSLKLIRAWRRWLLTDHVTLDWSTWFLMSLFPFQLELQSCCVFLPNDSLPSPSTIVSGDIPSTVRSWYHNQASMPATLVICLPQISVLSAGHKYMEPLQELPFEVSKPILEEGRLSLCI